MRRLLAAGALVLVAASLPACGGSGAKSESARELRRQADLYAIDQIEKTWHRATSRQDVDLMMTLWAPNATLTLGPGETLTGRDQIRRFWRDSEVFQPANHWVSDTPAYKIRITVNGDRGTLYFECHYVDPKTEKVVKFVGAHQQVARIDGHWMITAHVGASATLVP
jgi:ketosteroid isomerase-like protein